MKILLVKPKYYSPFPPMGLLKFATYYKNRGDEVKFHPHGLQQQIERSNPDKVLITSLWTWEHAAVHREIRLAKSVYPGAEIVVGGIYASLMPQHVLNNGADSVVVGLDKRVEDLVPDYSILPDGEWNGSEWEKSIVFTTRGCTNSCSFCAVPCIEGGLQQKTREQIENQIMDDHKWIVVMDNNIITSPSWDIAFDVFEDHGKIMGFNGGIDLREINDEQARRIAEMRTRSSIYAGFDNYNRWMSISTGLKRFKMGGQRLRDIVLYELYNYKDTPEDLFIRMKMVAEWGATSYPMRFQPYSGISALKKDSHISVNWNYGLLELIAKSRRILGTKGAFPPTEALKDRLKTAKDLKELLTINTKKGIPRPNKNQLLLTELFDE